MNEIILLTITTSLGSFDIELYQKEAPITANNFVEYVEQNFYENTLFHRVIPDFVILVFDSVAGYCLDIGEKVLFDSFCVTFGVDSYKFIFDFLDFLNI